MAGYGCFLMDLVQHMIFRIMSHCQAGVETQRFWIPQGVDFPQRWMQSLNHSIESWFGFSGFPGLRDENPQHLRYSPALKVWVQ